MAIPETAEDFLAEYHRLVDEAISTVGQNRGCLDVERCVSCVDCVFCTDCERCTRARYSVGCLQSFDITHCSHCAYCYASTFCEHSQHCSQSNYLIHCTDCVSCDYCFGCVGLRKVDFHILNRPYPRKQYFAAIKALKESVLATAHMIAVNPAPMHSQ